jgi:hypothetical protein
VSCLSHPQERASSVVMVTVTALGEVETLLLSPLQIRNQNLLTKAVRKCVKKISQQDACGKVSKLVTTDHSISLLHQAKADLSIWGYYDASSHFSVC